MPPIPLCPSVPAHRTPNGIAALAAAALFTLAAVLSAPPTALAQSQGATERGRITGRITGAPEGVALSGTRVVLLQFRLTAEGQPQGNPIQTQEAGADGGYAFPDVPIEERTVYQIGATVEGQVVGSEPFTFPAGEREVQLNLRYPHVTKDSSGVRIAEGLIAVEPRRGAVWVTEVLHLVNGGADTVDAVQRPLEVNLPSGAVDMEIMRELQQQDGHERLGEKLLFYGQLPPGRTTLAYRYRLPVWLGSASLEKRYPLEVGTLSVLSPQGALRLHGERFAPQKQQSIEGTAYDAWSTTQVTAGDPVAVRFSGVPVQQEVYLLPLAGFFLAMTGVVVWFLRRRVATQEEGDEEASA